MCFWRFKHQKAECHQTPLYLREYQTSLQPISPKAQQHTTVFWWTVPLIAIWAGLITRQTHCWGCNLLTSLLGEGTLWMNSSFAWRCHLFVKEQFKMATPTVSLWASLAVFFLRIWSCSPRRTTYRQSWISWVDSKNVYIEGIETYDQWWRLCSHFAKGLLMLPVVGVRHFRTNAQTYFFTSLFLRVIVWI